ncbi:sulfatase [Planctomycetota bacterium]|nr:sulfatase [Planctomycetota bacterium]
MKSNQLLANSLLSLTCATLPTTLSYAADTQPTKPNVLMISIDDLNDMIGCMQGHPNANTPNIDRLASQGTLFLSAHCQAPISGPSRASIMTGLRPSTSGIYAQIEDNDIQTLNPITQSSTLLHQYLKDHGYLTLGIGKIFHKHAPDGLLDISGGREQGFGPKPPQRLKWNRKGTSTDWGPFPERDEQMPDYRSAKWAIEKLNQDYDKPFFLSVGFLRPHVPWHVPQKWFDLHPLESIQVPRYLPGDQDDVPETSRIIAEVPVMPTTDWAIENNEWKNILQAYLASTSFVDHYVGKVLDALENSPYANNTIVILWSDHGYHLGEKNRFAKHSIWERSTRAPLIIKLPNQTQGQRCNKPVEMLDIYPTILELCNLPKNPQNEGFSLTPLIKDPFNPNWNHPAITTYGRNNHAIRTQQYRYIRYADGSEELYNHNADNDEWYNLANNPQFADIKLDLQKHIPKTNMKWDIDPTIPDDHFLKRVRDLELNYQKQNKQ